MGHRTHGRLTQTFFAQSPECDYEVYWLDEDKELLSRIINRLLSYKMPGQWSERQNVDMRRVRAEVGYGLLGRRLAVRHLRRNEKAILHFHTQIGAYMSTDLMRKVPTVVTGDITAAQCAVETTSQKFRWTHTPSCMLDSSVFHAAKRIVFWSDWAAQSIIHDYGISPEIVSVIPPGVDLAAIASPDDKLYNGPIHKGLIKLLFVGADFRRKGGDDVLDVYLKTFSAQTELHIVTGAEVHCSHPRVHIHRGVKAYSSRWQELYQQSDIFVLPTYHEAFGLVFAEAMAAGLPVVATNINAIPEIVTDGVTGFLIQAGDRVQLAERLRRLISDVSLRRAMGAEGRAVALKKFDARLNFQELELVFLELADVAGQG